VALLLEVKSSVALTLRREVSVAHALGKQIPSRSFSEESSFQRLQWLLLIWERSHRVSCHRRGFPSGSTWVYSMSLFLARIVS